MAEVILTFEWDGKGVAKEAVGFSGKSCEQTMFIEQALGAKDENLKFKPEYMAATAGRFTVEDKVKVRH